MSDNSNEEYESPLRRALKKAQDIDVPAGINFLNQMSAALTAPEQSEYEKGFEAGCAFVLATINEQKEQQ